ncbi:MAG: response regulator [Desulfobacterales bacterium]|nr:response regulator [Desulfobacterales bacterium]MCP4163439.1 response regulator [Deltaproteobacteria bacterium]
MIPNQILLIDSDKYIRESLNTFFNNGKDSFLIFKSANEGLNALEYQKIDVVISDYFLPDMDGVKFLIKAAEMSPGITRILMTTILSEDLRIESINAGIDALLEKPLSISSLDSILAKIDKKNLNRTENGVK